MLLFGGHFPSRSGACLIEDGAVATMGRKHKVLTPGVGKPTSEESKSVTAFMSVMESMSVMKSMSMTAFMSVTASMFVTASISMTASM